MRTTIRGARVTLISSRTLSRKRHSIYAIIADAKYVKFGYASDPHKGLLAIRSGCPLELRIGATLVAKCERQAIEWEELLHTAAARFHVRGEWFASNPRTLGFVSWMGLGAERFEVLIAEAAKDERLVAEQMVGGVPLPSVFPAAADRRRVFPRPRPRCATPESQGILGRRFDKASETV